jgi:hypothetical protein
MLAQLGQQLHGLSMQLLGEMQQANLESQFANAKTEATLAFQDWFAAMPRMDITETEIKQIQQPDMPAMPPTGEGISSAPSRVPNTITSNYKNYDKYLENYENFQGQLYDRVVGGLKHPRAKAAFDEWWGGTMTNNRAKVIDYRINAELGQLGADWMARKDYYVDSRDKSGFVSDTRRMVELGVLSPAKGEEAINLVTQEINRLSVEDAALAMGAEEGLRWLSETTEPMERFDITSDEQLEIYRKLSFADQAKKNREAKVENERMRKGFWDAEQRIRAGQYFTPEDLNKSQWNYTEEAKSKILGFQDQWIRADAIDRERVAAKKESAYVAQMGVKLADGTLTNEDLNDIRDRYPDYYPEFLGAYQKLTSGETDPAEMERIRWEGMLSSLYRDGNAPALKQMLDQTFIHENPRIADMSAEWATKYRTLLNDLQADRERARTGKSAFDITAPELYFQYTDMLWDPNTGAEYIKDWLDDHHGPDALGNPQFSSNDFDRAMGEVDKIKEGQIYRTTAARQGAQDIMDVGKAWLKEAETTEEQLRVKDLTRDILDAYTEKHEEFADPTEFARKLLQPPLEKQAGQGVRNFVRSVVGEGLLPAILGGGTEIPSWDFEQINWESDEWPERKEPGQIVEPPVNTPSGMIQSLIRARSIAYFDDNGDTLVEFNKEGTQAVIWGKDEAWHRIDIGLARQMVGR